LKGYFRTIRDCDDVQQEISLKPPFYTAVHVRSSCTLRSATWTATPARSSSIVARAPRTGTSWYRRASAWCSRATFTPHRAIGLTQPVHPHLLRRQLLTYLSAKGLTDAQTQPIYRRESQKSLEVYQYLSLASVDKAYQAAVQAVVI
jgi:integrase